jgi:hypothetical protein|tara:strand:+ start:2159 stop:2389 length:231 start_codon:yes stop_codon:yes gene_type:complete
MKIKVIHSTRKHASKQGQVPGAVVHKLLTVLSTTPPLKKLARGTLYISIEQKFYSLAGMHSSFSPLSRWRVHPLMP